MLNFVLQASILNLFCISEYRQRDLQPLCTYCEYDDGHIGTSNVIYVNVCVCVFVLLIFAEALGIIYLYFIFWFNVFSVTDGKSRRSCRTTSKKTSRTRGTKYGTAAAGKMEAEKKDLLEQVKQLKQAELEAWRAALWRLIAFQELEHDLAPRNENPNSLSHYRGCPSPCSQRHDAAEVRKVWSIKESPVEEPGSPPTATW